MCCLEVTLMAFWANFDPNASCREQVKDPGGVQVFKWRRHEWLDG